ncbi:hypothetical protein C8Q77DRAFT_1140669 [Trametes polyzona]|nr:hypothetical protein C8Q77DRAFT_1140669 [Trametes polyzona]
MNSPTMTPPFQQPCSTAAFENAPPGGPHSKSSVASPAGDGRTDSAADTAPRPQCVSCDKPLTVSYIPDTNTLQRGDVCAVHETVSTPVWLLLRDRRPPSQCPPENMSWGTAQYAARVRSQASKSRSHASTFPTEYARPAVVFTKVDLSKTLPSKDPVNICIMTSLKGVDNSRNLPHVLRHLCIAISPHIEAVPGVAHTHTTPEWKREGTWLLLYRFTTILERVTGRWTDTISEDQRITSFNISVEELKRLDVLCTTRLASWDLMCANDPGLRERSLKEYQARVAEIAEKGRRSSSQVKSHRTSQASTPRSGPTSPVTPDGPTVPVFTAEDFPPLPQSEPQATKVLGIPFRMPKITMQKPKNKKGLSRNNEPNKNASKDAPANTATGNPVRARFPAYTSF